MTETILVEDRVRALETEVALHKQELERFAEALEANTVAIRELTASLNQSKGAVWILGGFISLATLVISIFAAFNGKSV